MSCWLYTGLSMARKTPTGVGKTYVIKLIADKIGVPFVKGDATKFSETGYVGGDVEDLVRDLVREADDDIDLARTIGAAGVHLGRDDADPATARGTKVTFYDKVSEFDAVLGMVSGWPGIGLFKTTDGGRTWSEPVLVAER